MTLTGEDGLARLVGLEIGAVCFVRDYVELHFDGPILRALANPFGLYGYQGWQFPDGNSPTVTRYYIGKTIHGYEYQDDRFLAIDSGEHRFAVSYRPRGTLRTGSCAPAHPGGRPYRPLSTVDLVNLQAI